MPGFPLAAIGAGLGLFAKQYQEQQAAAERNKMLQMQLAMFQQQMQDRQGQNELSNLDLSGVGAPTVQPTPGGASAVPPLGGGMPFAPKMPKAQPDYGAPGEYGVGQAQPAGGGSAGGGNWEVRNNNFAGMRRPGVPAAGGPMTNPSGWQSFDTPEAGIQGIANQLDRYASGATTGSPLTTIRQIVSTWAPPSENPTARLIARASQVVGVSPDQPLDLSNPVVKGKLVEAMIRGEQGGNLPIDQSVITRALSGGGGPAAGAPVSGQQMAQAGPQTATDAGPQDDLQAQIAKIPLPSPPDLHLDEVRRRINATNARWEDKERMLQNYIAQRGPQAKAAYDQAMEQYKVHVGVAEKEWAERNKQRDRASEGGSLIERPEGTYREKGGIATPVTVAGTGQPLGPATRLGTGAAGGKTSHNVEVTDADGKVIFSGSAHQGPQGWISDKDQQSVQIPESGNIKILGTGGQGRQAAQQIQSMVGASSELVGEARNLMELPSTATAGVFQGLQGIPAAQLGDTLKRTLANKLTPEESTDLATSFQGVARSLATIEAQGRATGLVGLTGMSQGLIPQTGDTIGNIWRKYATLRQIMERNIDAIQASPNASPEQKGLLKKLRTEMESVIPFTVSDVNKMQHGDAQSFSQAAQKAGLGRGGAGGPPPEAVEALRNDKRPTAQQDFDAIFGAGAAVKALGGGTVPTATPGAL